MVVVADKDTVSGEIRRWSVTNGKCIGCGAEYKKIWPCVTWWPTEVQQPTMKTNPSLSKPFISTFAPLMADNNVDSPLTYLVYSTACVPWHIYERWKAGNSALPCLPWSPTHPALLQPGSLGGLHYIEMASSPDKGDLVVIYSDVFPFAPESSLLENDTSLVNRR